MSDNGPYGNSAGAYIVRSADGSSRCPDLSSRVVERTWSVTDDDRRLAAAVLRAKSKPGSSIEGTR